MKTIFNSIKLSRPNRNNFDLTHDIKFSARMGKLVPVMCLDCVPGDSFKLGCETVVRMAPMIAPPMHRVDVFVHTFFVPYRILWPNFGTYMTQSVIDGAPVPAKPFITFNSDPTGQWAVGCVADYLGIPNPDQSGAGTANEKINALPFAAYLKIWAEYYRDQNLMDVGTDWNGADSPAVLVDGDNTTWYNTWFNTGAPKGVCRERCWEHDYFTSSLPFAQKGSAVDIPLGEIMLKDDTTNAGKFVSAATHADDNWTGGLASSGATGEVTLVSGAPKLGVYDPNGTLESEATTINDLRTAFRVQEWLEANARGGTRYTEHIRVHFGVTSSDKRLQRPEYITGAKSPVIISEVLNTAGNDALDLPQGNMAGHGIGVVAGSYGKYYVEEHGCIMSILSVMPKSAYQNGIPKNLLKTGDSFELFYPKFAHLGEQEVSKKELFGFANGNDSVFGYVPRYAEYKYEPNRIAGEFRSSLAYWTFARKFASIPSLNEEFVACVPTKDPFAVVDPGTHELYIQHLNKVNASRLMPVFGTPHI